MKKYDLTKAEFTVVTPYDIATANYLDDKNFRLVNQYNKFCNYDGEELKEVEKKEDAEIYNKYDFEFMGIQFEDEEDIEQNIGIENIEIDWINETFTINEGTFFKTQ